MAMRLDAKKAVVDEVAAVAGNALSAIAAEYRGLTVAEMTELRSIARASGVRLRVVKNSLARRALENTDFSCMREGLVGPLMLAFSMEDPGAAARLISDFAKDHPQCETKLVAVDRQLYDALEIDRLAKLPTRDQAIGMLMAVIKAPIEKLVRTMAEPHAKLVRTVASVRDQKQAA